MKYKIFFRFILLFVGLLRGGIVLAQTPANDECDNATVIQPRTLGIDLCSNVAAYTTVGATPSTVGAATCFGSSAQDIWFSFTAIGTDLTITIFGNGSGGTLRVPEIALYVSSNCQSFAQWACASDRNDNSPNNHIVNLYKGGITPGDRYLVRVQGQQAGTFQLCINNYNAPANPSSDCPQAAILCDKSPFKVQSVTGAGANPRELDDATCFGGGASGSNESNSTWFKWTCQESGSLTFDLTPDKIDDDLDFVVYELTNGLETCNPKILLRCMASGDFNYPSRCMGRTGLRDGETDISEPAGCNLTSQNNYLSPVQMVAGRSYALVVNNFTSTGNGFSISFGGTGTFQGPQAKILTNKPNKRACIGEDIIFTDGSTFVNGNIVAWKWNFGQTASRDTISGRGGHRIFYKRPGWKSIALTVTSDKGCVTTTILDSIYVEGFQYDSVITQPTCALGTNGKLKLSVRNCGRAPILYNWENTGFSTRDSLTSLGRGNYMVVVTDSSRFYFDTIRFRLSYIDLEFDTATQVIRNPTCSGLSNGRISLSMINGTAPYEYRWNGNSNWTRDSFLAALPQGQYTVEVRDRDLCRGNFTFDVIAPPPIEVGIDTVNISCFGLRDGRATALVSGGVGNYSYNWSNGATSRTATNLAAGNYMITVLDANLCQTSNSVRITEPPTLRLDSLRATPTVCFGDSSGSLILRGGGGTPPYRYSLDGVRYQTSDTFRAIPARTYNVVIKDSTNCRLTRTMTVPSATPLQVSAGTDILIDLGFSAQLRAVIVPSTRAVSYRWSPTDSLSCTNCASVTARPVRSTLYRVFVRDSNGCTASDDIWVNVNKKRPIFIPNAFSPNRDGLNDFFTAYGNQSAVIIREMRIFNRWGDLIFTAQNIPLGDERVGWDGLMNGKDLPPDVYAYYMVIRFIDGEEETYHGDITILK